MDWGLQVWWYPILVLCEEDLGWYTGILYEFYIEIHWFFSWWVHWSQDERQISAGDGECQEKQSESGYHQKINRENGRMEWVKSGNIVICYNRPHGHKLKIFLSQNFEFTVTGFFSFIDQNFNVVFEFSNWSLLQFFKSICHVNFKLLKMKF